jgi:hypothetical protein
MPQDIAFAIRRVGKGLLLPLSCFDHRKRCRVSHHLFERRA